MKELQERDVKVHADFSENGPQPEFIEQNNVRVVVDVSADGNLVHDRFTDTS